MPSRYRMQTGTSGRADYSPGLSLPSRIESERASLFYMIPLLMFAPPAGLLVMWLSERYALRTRIILSALAVISLAVIVMVFNISRTPDPLLPGPSIPTSAPTPQPYVTYKPVTPQPTNDPSGVRVTPPPTITAEPTPEPMVYSVTKKAIYYHSVKKCEGQTNRRTTTLSEAKALGLTPCPDCKPPG